MQVPHTALNDIADRASSKMAEHVTQQRLHAGGLLVGQVSSLEPRSLSDQLQHHICLAGACIAYAQHSCSHALCCHEMSAGVHCSRTSLLDSK